MLSLCSGTRSLLRVFLQQQQSPIPERASHFPFHPKIWRNYRSSPISPIRFWVPSRRRHSHDAQHSTIRTPEDNLFCFSFLSKVRFSEPLRGNCHTVPAEYSQHCLYSVRAQSPLSIQFGHPCGIQDGSIRQVIFCCQEGEVTLHHWLAALLLLCVALPSFRPHTIFALISVRR